MSPTLPVASRTRSPSSAAPVADAAQAPGGQGAAAPRYETRMRVRTGETALSHPDVQASSPKRQRTDPSSFSREERQALVNANKVLVLEYSSTGGGHTARSLDPVAMAARNGTLTHGDCVVIAAPPRWVQDKDGRNVKTLHTKVQELQELGLKVILKQGDKTVTGLYKPNGDSDNVGMLRDFVYKPQRDATKTPKSTDANPDDMVISGRPVQTRPGASVKSLLNSVIEAVGAEHKGKIAVVGDMAPALQKEAKEAKIYKSLEIGNHQSLFIDPGREKLGDKNLAYLHKASGGGHAEKVALVEYSGEVNVVKDVASTMAGLGITEHSSVAVSRQKAVEHLLTHATRLSLDKDAPVGGGILVSPGARQHDDVKAFVYLYLNQYTTGAVNEVRQKMAEHPDTFGKSLFAVCAGGAFKPDANGPQNMLMVMYAGHADGVTNAGFGTTSEFDYMAKHGYAGDFVAFPVVNQHEQEANAAVLKAGSEPGRVTDATGGTDKLYAALEALVNKRCEQAGGPTSHLSPDAGSAGELHHASQSPTSGPDHAAKLLASLFAADDAQAEPMRENAHLAMDAMSAYNAENPAKESRRIFKLLVPALDAMIKQVDTCHVRATTKVDSTELSVADVARHLSAIGSQKKTRLREVAQALMGVEFGHASSQRLAYDLSTELRSILVHRDAGQRKAAAERMLTHLAENRVALGW